MPKRINPNPDQPPLLQMQAASLVKNGRRILDRLSLEIREGEHTAILGPNGAGKSSFIQSPTPTAPRPC
jgi:iron complex transport system ATP-binding protein